MKNRISKSIDACGITKERILDSWKELVEIESYTHDPAAVRTLSTHLKDKFEAMGFKTKEYIYEKSGPLLIAEWGEGAPSEGIILTGHMDTVFKTGYLEEHPFRVKDGLVYGPGVLDMKGGINLIFYIVELLQYMDYKHPIKIIISGDEEHGHQFSECAKHMQEEAHGYKCAFNMETGLLDNKITTARKGRMEYTFKVHGVSAHAGANFHDGVNAIYELAHILTAVNALNGKYDNVTFSAGIVRGGEIVNAIPDYAEAKIDIRYYGEHLREAIIGDLDALCNTPHICGARTESDFLEGFPSFMDTLNQKLYTIAENTSIECGLGKTEQTKLGGSSDASFLTIAGIPCLCSMGIPGEWNHTNREYARIDDALDRIMLITGTILNIEGVSLSDTSIPSIHTTA